ncbi:transposable element Tcb2 transposase [Trichonephila clavipes]|nr:transposable element Tcb2 transposase [Trichonephila clavipes]
MDDNARTHQALAVEELLESEDITRMDWPAYSPDLNPIEHLWNALGRRIAARLHHPENTEQLKQKLIEECVLLPQEMLHQLVLSMRRRCEATIAPRICTLTLSTCANFLAFQNSITAAKAAKARPVRRTTKTPPTLPRPSSVTPLDGF